MEPESQRPAGADTTPEQAESAGPDSVLRPEPSLDRPPPSSRYRRHLRLGTSLGALGRSRSIIWSLAIRDLRSTYSQEILGFSWALLAPITLMVVFTFLSDRVGTIDTGQAPDGSSIAYPVFSYMAILPWSFFASSVSTGGTSLINNPLLNKVYAPREVFPIAQVITSAVSFAAASVALIVLFVIYGETPAATSYWVPILLLILVIFILGVTFVVSSMTVYVRDMRHALPLILQLGLFLTPIIYGLDVIAEEWRALYVAINPIAAVITGLRESVLYGEVPDPLYTGIAAVMAVVWFLGGYMMFKRLETGFADVS